MKKLKWNKDGDLEYAGVAKHAETGAYMLIYRDRSSLESINLVSEFDPESYTQKGMPRNRKFDLVE